MQRLRLKADGRIVELRDGQEFPLQPAMSFAEPAETGTPVVRALRRRARLTQHEFAAKLGVPVETIRNWEQVSAHRADRRGRCSPSLLTRRKWCSPRWRRPKI
jgi:DNA-binding XRE family transcriptional regulator